MMNDKSLAVRMTPVVYSSILTIVEARLHSAVWQSKKISDVVDSRPWSGYHKVVYIVLDGENLVAYVGSTIRSISDRLSEHIKIDNRSNWERVMIVPLKDGIVDAELREYEGLVGRRLRPYDNSKLPNLSY